MTDIKQSDGPFEWTPSLVIEWTAFFWGRITKYIKDNRGSSEPIDKIMGDFIKRQTTHKDTLNNVPNPVLERNQKPPLGLKPFWLHNENRLEDINAAMDRYRQDNKEIPDEWINEKQSLEAMLQGHQKEEGKDWEIVEFENKKGDRFFIKDGEYRSYWWGDEISGLTEADCLSGHPLSIHSVKRLSDGEVFSVKQGVEFGEGFGGVIEEFYIVGTEMRVRGNGFDVLIGSIRRYRPTDNGERIKVYVFRYSGRGQEGSEYVFETSRYIDVKYMHKIKDLIEKAINETTGI